MLKINEPIESKEKQTNVEEESTISYIKHDKSIALALEFMNSDKTDLNLRGCIKLQKIIEKITPNDAISLGICDRIIESLYSNSNIQNINQKLKFLIRMSFSNILEQTPLHSVQFLQFILFIDEKYHYSYGETALNLLINLLLDPIIGHTVFLNLHQINFESHLIQKFFSLDDVYLSEIDETFEERLTYVKSLTQLLVIICENTNSNDLLLFIDIIPKLMLLFKRNMDLAIIDSLFKTFSYFLENNDLFHICMQNNIRDIIINSLTDANPMYATSITRCYLNLLKHDDANNIPIDIIHYLMTDIVHRENKYQKYVFEILFFISKTRPDLIMQSNVIQQCIQIHEFLPFQTRLYNLSFILFNAQKFDEATSLNLFLSVESYIVEALDSQYEQEIINILSSINLILHFPSICDQIRNNQQILDNLESFIELENSISEYSQNILSKVYPV